MILVADLHLTDRERDEYRWELVPWLRELVSVRGGPVIVMGDLTDEKDRHPARLVNRIVKALRSLECQVYVMMGNHDYIDAGCPFFGFLTGQVEFVQNPTLLCMRNGQDEPIECLMLPHTRTPTETWDRLSSGEYARAKPDIVESADVILCHQTFKGASAGGGHVMREGVSSTYWSERGFRGRVFSGDIHVPQKIGDVTYVGSPYPIAFGDQHEGRALIVELDGVKVKKHLSIRRASLELHDVDEILDSGLRTGDQAKVRVHLSRSEFATWDVARARLAAHAATMGVQLFAVELIEKKGRRRSVLDQDDAATRGSNSRPVDVLRAFCETRRIDESLEDVAVDLANSVEREGLRS
jgi:DNA repair exonuclease SbcCD nuclease subunit